MVNSDIYLFCELVDNALYIKLALEFMNVCFKFFYTIELGIPLMIWLFFLTHFSNWILPSLRYSMLSFLLTLEARMLSSLALFINLGSNLACFDTNLTCEKRFWSVNWLMKSISLPVFSFSGDCWVWEAWLLWPCRIKFLLVFWRVPARDCCWLFKIEPETLAELGLITPLSTAFEFGW